MPGSAGEAVLDIRTNSSSFFADIDKSKKETLSLTGVFQQAAQFFEGFGRGVNQTARELEKATAAADGFGASFGKIVGGFLTAQAIWSGATALWNGLTGAIVSSVAAAGDAEKSHTKVTAALRAQGTAIPSVVDAYQQYATELQRTTVFQDDAVESAEALLVQVGNVMPRDMKKALQATTDLASGLGVDLTDAALLVSKAAEGNVTALKKHGVAVDEVKAKQLGFGYVLDQVTAKFGGQAAAAAGTYQGRVAQLSATWNNVQESIGRAITTNATVLGIIERINKAIDANTGELNQNKLATDLVSGSILLAVRGVALFLRGIDLLATGLEGLILLARRSAQAIDNIALESLAIVRVAALVQGNMDLYALATAAAEALQKRIAALGEANAATVQRFDSFGNKVETISGLATRLADDLEKTRGKTVAVKEATTEAGDAWDRQTTAVKQSNDAIEQLEKSLETLDIKLTPLPGHWATASDQAKVYGEEADKLMRQADLLGIKVPASIRAVAEAWQRSELTKVVETLTKQWFADLDKFNAEGAKKLDGITKSLGDAIIRNDATMRDALLKASQLSDERLKTALDVQLTEVDRWVQAEKAKLDERASNWKQAADAIDLAAEGMRQKLLDAESLASMTRAVTAFADQAESGFSGKFLEIARGIPDLLKQGVLGGGGLRGAGQAIGIALGALIGQTIGQGRVGQFIADGLANMFHAAGPAAAGALATAVSGALTAAFAIAGGGGFGATAQLGSVGASIGIAVGAGLSGALIGGGVGAAFGLLFDYLSRTKIETQQVEGLLNDLFDKVGGNLKALRLAGDEAALVGHGQNTRAEIEAYQADLDALIARAKAAGVSLDEFFSARRSGDANRLQQAIRDLSDAFQFQDQAVQDLNDTVKKYHFSIEELGPAMRKQQLDKQAQEIYHDWQVLASAGIDLNAIMREMGDNVNQFVQDAIKFGIDVPEALRPFLEDMAKAGELTDATGNKITDLDKAGIHFTLSMSDGFKALIKAVDRLTQAIARALGITIDLSDAINSLPPLPPTGPSSGGSGGDGSGDPNREAAGDYFRRIPRAVKFTVGEAGPEDAVFGGAGRNLARDVAVELAQLLPKSWSTQDSGGAPRVLQMVVDGRVLGEVAMDGLHAGGRPSSKFKTLVQRSL